MPVGRSWKDMSDDDVRVEVERSTGPIHDAIWREAVAQGQPGDVRELPTTGLRQVVAWVQRQRVMVREGSTRSAGSRPADERGRPYGMPVPWSKATEDRAAATDEAIAATARDLPRVRPFVRTWGGGGEAHTLSGAEPPAAVIDVARTLGCTPAAAAAYLARGEAPNLQPVIVQEYVLAADSDVSAWERPRIRIDVDAWVPASEVLLAFREVQRSVLAQDGDKARENRQLSPRSVALVRFVLAPERIHLRRWAERMRAWNAAERPEWRYAESRFMARDYARAQRALVRRPGTLGAHRQPTERPGALRRTPGRPWCSA